MAEIHINKKVFLPKQYTSITEACESLGEGMTIEAAKKLAESKVKQDFNATVGLYNIKAVGSDTDVIDLGANAVICKLKNGKYIALPISKLQREARIGYKAVEHWSASVLFPDYQYEYGNYKIPLVFSVIGYLGYYAQRRSYVYCEEGQVHGVQFMGTKTVKECIVEPHQPISNDTLPVDITIYHRTISFNSIQTWDNGYYTETLTRLDPKYFYDFDTYLNENETKTIVAKGTQYNKNLADFVIKCGTYKNKTHFIEQKEAKPYCYAYLPLGQDFANNFSIKTHKSNDYYEETTTASNLIDLSKMNKKSFAENEDISFTYDYNGNVYEFNSSLKPISFKVGNAKFLFTTKQEYLFGETLDLNQLDILNTNNKLCYTDGKTTTFDEIKQNYSVSANATTTLVGTNPYQIPYEEGTFSITYDINIDQNKYPYTYNCNIKKTPGYYEEAKMSGEKTSFNINEQLTFGEGAVLTLFEQNNTVEKLYPTFLDDGTITTKPDDYENILDSNFAKDEIFERSYIVNDKFTLIWKFTVNYYENFKIDISQVKLKYIYNYKTKPEFILNTDGLVATIDKHTNTLDNIGQITTENIDISKLKISKITPKKDVTTYSVNISYTNEFNQTFTSKYDITIEERKPIKIVTSGTEDYWDTGSDTFRLPTNISFSYYFNDNSNPEIITDLSNFEYFLDEAKTNKLIKGQSIISSSTVTDRKIFFTDSFGLSGYYLINLNIDSLVSLKNRDNATKKDFILGNTFDSFKDKLEVDGVFESNRVDSISDYEFVYKDLVLEPRDIEIKKDTILANLGQVQVNYTNPAIDNVEIALNGFKTAYTNSTDNIDCRKIVIQVHYKDSSYVQELKYSALEPTSYNTFKVSCSIDLDIGSVDPFTFDGKSIINASLGNDSEIFANLIFSFKNRFTNQIETKEMPIAIYEILDVIGITIFDAYDKYIVNDTFLNEKDTTKAKIYFNDKNNVQKSIIINLNSQFNGINISPVKGHKFNKITNSYPITVTSVTDYNVRATYNVRVLPSDSANNTVIHNIVALFVEEYNELKNKYILIDEKLNDNKTFSTKIFEGRRVINNTTILNGENANVKVYGYLDDIGDRNKNAKVVLFNDYVPPIDGKSNISVKYPCYVEGNADLINKCHFGIQFGNNNSRNRLFVSGNSSKPNFDWHSGDISATDQDYAKGDYVYFEDTSYCAYGSTDNAVVGYDIISDDKLAVLKNHSLIDTTLYFRTATLVTAISGSGTTVQGIDGQTLYQEEFALSKGNNSVAGVSPQAMLNFNGDTVFLSSEKTLMGLDLIGIIGDNQRYATSRSKLIDLDLEKYDMKDCWLWSNNKYLCIVMPDKVYITHFETMSNKQYEWWVMGIKDIQSIIELNGKIYFANSNGELYKMNNVYSDVMKIYSSIDNATIDDIDMIKYQNDNKIYVTQEIIDQLEENKKYYFKSIPNTDDVNKKLYYKLANVSNTKGGTLDFLITKNNTLSLIGLVDGKTNFDRIKEVLGNISDKKYVFLNHLENEDGELLTDNPDLRFEIPYVLKRCEDTELATGFAEYKLYDLSGKEMALYERLNRCLLCYQLEGTYEIVDINKKEASFKLKFDKGKIIDLVQYGKQQLYAPLTGEIKEIEPVEAYYITAPMVFNDLNYFKTLWQYTLTNDTGKPSDLELSYASNKIPYTKTKTLAKISVDDLELDLDELSFNKVDFDKNIVPRTYTVDRMMTNLKFICFNFRSIIDAPSILSSMSIVYSTSAPAYSGD